MAQASYADEISSLLRSGIFSDLTLHFGEKTWKIHKNLAACHSRWFMKALTTGLQETTSGEITLHDDIQFADAIECMVMSFYQPDYTMPAQHTAKPLLHAQVAIIADEYECASLYARAKTAFEDTIKGIKLKDWGHLATFVYEFTSTEVPAHRDLRRAVIAALEGRDFIELDLERLEDSLRANADLATDLLLGRKENAIANGKMQNIFTCDDCRFIHAGSQDCVMVVLWPKCTKCGSSSTHTDFKWIEQGHKVTWWSCSGCSGTCSHPRDTDRAPKRRRIDS